MRLNRPQAFCAGEPRCYLGFQRRLRGIHFGIHWKLRLPAVPRPIGPGSCARASSPLRSLFAAPPGRPSSERPLLPGFLPSSRQPRRRPRPRHCFLGAPCGVREIPTSRFVPPSGFLSLSAACSVNESAGLFHPAATSRVSSRAVQGILPTTQRFPARRRTLPPCRCPARAHRRPGCHTRGARLRGFVLRVGACGRGGGLVLPVRRSPLRLFPPAGAGFTTVSPVPRTIRS